MITYIEKGIHLHYAISDAGHFLTNKDGEWVSDNEQAVQQIIDNFDPLPFAQKEAIGSINKAAGEARQRYVTNAPSQDDTYHMKLEDAKAFKANGYVSAEDYSFIAMEADSTGLTPQQVADLVIETYNQWKQLASHIESVRRGGVVAVQSETDWTMCSLIAKECVDTLGSL